MNAAVRTLAVSLLLAAIALSIPDALHDARHFHEHWRATLLTITWGLVVAIVFIEPVGWILALAGCGGSDSRTSQWMGAVERLSVYALLLAGAPKAVGALVIFKTAIRWPKIEGKDGSKFAETFFLAMLINIGIAAAVAWIAGADFRSIP